MSTDIATKPRKFFDISKDISAYLELQTQYAMENEGEISPIMEEWETEFFQELAQKTDNVAGFIQAVELEAVKVKAERDFFAKKLKSLENLASKIKKFLVGFMQYESHKVLQGELYKISLTNNGGKVPLKIYPHILDAIEEKIATIVLNENLIPEKYRKQIWVLDKEKIRLALENGELLEIASLESRGQHIRIS